jgi:glucan phosphoethanolaminetransferase (alkaline phosphatase superfamily)
VLDKNMDKKFKVISIISLSFFLLVAIINFLIPKLEFNKPEYNRAFGIFFNLYCFYVLFLFLKLIRRIRNKVFKTVMITLNIMFLLIAMLSLAFYLMKIDPQTQYHDVEIIYYNNENKFDRIIYQYYVNWKTNEKVFRENRIYDIGPFRYFIEYNVDTSDLKDNWIQTETKSNLFYPL